MAVSSDGAVWISGWDRVEPVLMRYDGATMEPVPVGDYQPGEFRIFWIEAAPNGDLWITGDIPTDDAYLPLIARFDGETWMLYDTGGYAYNTAVSGSLAFLAERSLDSIFSTLAILPRRCASVGIPPPEAFSGLR